MPGARAHGLHSAGLFELKSNSIGLVKQVVKQVLKGLKFLHECRVVHGDVHPGNILVRRRAGTDSKVFDVKISGLGAGKPQTHFFLVCKTTVLIRSQYSVPIRIPPKETRHSHRAPEPRAHHTQPCRFQG